MAHDFPSGQTAAAYALGGGALATAALSEPVWTLFIRIWIGVAAIALLSEHADAFRARERGRPPAALGDRVLRAVALGGLLSSGGLAIFVALALA